MTEATRRLSDAVEARKQATWAAVEAQAMATESRRRVVRVALAGLALVAVAVASSWVSPRSASTPHDPGSSLVSRTKELHDTAYVAIVRAGASRGAIERVMQVSDGSAIERVSDREALRLLAESGLPAGLIRIGDRAQVAFHRSPESGDRSEEQPGESPSGPVQNF